LANRPDILVVLVDQLARHALSRYGDPNTRTPEIDRMAAEGLAFEAMCSTFPACVPFRFSMMTGQYAHSRMVPALGYRMSPAERTLGEAIQAAGYQTAYMGKWHLYSLYGVVGNQTLAQANRTPIPASHRRGWDIWRGFELRNDFYDTWFFEDDDPEPKRLPKPFFAAPRPVWSMETCQRICRCPSHPNGLLCSSGMTWLTFPSNRWPPGCRQNAFTFAMARSKTSTGSTTCPPSTEATSHG